MNIKNSFSIYIFFFAIVITSERIKIVPSSEQIIITNIVYINSRINQNNFYI